MTGADETEALAGHNEGDPSVLDFTTPVREEGQETRPWQPMTIDGHVVYVREPKGAFMLGLAQHLSTDNGAAQAAAVAEMIDKIFDVESAVHVRERLNDDDDDFDTDELGVVFERLREVWAKRRRPTGRSSASRSRSATTSKRSTGRRR